MQESIRHNGNLYLGWDLSNPEEVAALEEQMGAPLAEAERIESDEAQRLNDLENAIAELAFGGGDV